MARIGAVIGHELSHGFDDSGRKFDGEGNLADWWTDADGKNFEQRAACIADQYSGYSPVNDPKTGKPAMLQGKLTLGENIGDNGGVRIAYMALANTQGGQPAASRDGLTSAQRFFLGYAQVWCQNSTEEDSLQRIVTDPHSPGRFRVNGVVSNMPEFAEAFKCKPGAPMAPEKRCASGKATAHGTWRTGPKTEALGLRLSALGAQQDAHGAGTRLTHLLWHLVRSLLPHLSSAPLPHIPHLQSALLFRTSASRFRPSRSGVQVINEQRARSVVLHFLTREASMPRELFSPSVVGVSSAARRGRVLPVSIALHGVVLGTLILLPALCRYRAPTRSAALIFTRVIPLAVRACDRRRRPGRRCQSPSRPAGSDAAPLIIQQDAVH